LQAGLAGRLIDYYPKVEFIVFRRDHCAEAQVPPHDAEKLWKEMLEEEGKGTKDKEDAAESDDSEDAKEKQEKERKKDMRKFYEFLKTESGNPNPTKDELIVTWNKMWQEQFYPDGWLVTGRLWITRSMHDPKEKSQLIDNEAFLQGWSEKLYSSNETIKMWKQALKKRKVTEVIKKGKDVAGCESI
jgi:hypothetical protein